MISRVEDYKYVGGDINDIMIDGNVMPYRARSAKKILRGEDITCLIEGAWERRSWRNRAHYWKWHEGGSTAYIDENPDAYNLPWWNQYPFHKELLATGQGSIGDAENLVHSLFYGGSDYLYDCKFLKTSLSEVSFSENMTAINEMFRNACLLESDYITPTTDNVLRQERIENDFVNLTAPQYALYHCTLKPRWVWNARRGATFEDIQMPLYYADWDGGGEDRYRIGSASLTNSRTVFIEEVKYINKNDVRVYAHILLEGFYNPGTGCGPFIYMKRDGFVDITTLLVKDTLRGAIILDGPIMSQEYGRQLLSDNGFPLYEESDIENGCSCAWYMTIEGYIQAKLDCPAP